MKSIVYIFQHTIFTSAVILASCDQKKENHAPPSRSEQPELESQGGVVQSQAPLNGNSRDIGDHKMGQNELLQQTLMKDEKPNWLKIGPSRKVDLIEIQENDVPHAAATTKNAIRGADSVTLGEISIKMPDDFRANGISHDVMNGMVVLRRNTEARIYKIEDNALIYAPNAPLPRFNYGEPRRWYLSNWQWLDSNSLIVISNEENPETDMIAESRIYTYNINTQTLQRAIVPESLGLKGEIKLISVEGQIIKVRNYGKVILLRLI